MLENPPMTVEMQRRIATTIRRRHRHSRWAGRDIKYSEVLRPWMLAYADWLFSCPEMPTLAERRNQLAYLSKKSITVRHLKALEARQDFSDYMDALQAGPMAEARAKYTARLPKYVDAYDTSINQMLAQKEYKDVAQAVQPAIDRVFPRKSDVVAATQVNVVISPEQLKGFSAYAPAVVATEVAPDVANDP